MRPSAAAAINWATAWGWSWKAAMTASWSMVSG